jgi:hypothetical protein
MDADDFIRRNADPVWLHQKENLMDFDDASEITISGLVMATDWNDDDDIEDLEISTDDDSYYVGKNAIWDELVDLWHTHVEVTGIVTEEKDGTKRVLVTSYEPLDDPSYDDDTDPNTFFEKWASAVSFRTSTEEQNYKLEPIQCGIRLFIASSVTILLLLAWLNKSV